MSYMRFLPKAITVYFEEKERFECKNNYMCGKSANYRQDNISKINYRMLVVLSYTLSKLKLRKIQLIERLFK